MKQIQPIDIILLCKIMIQVFQIALTILEHQIVPLK